MDVQNRHAIPYGWVFSTSCTICARSQIYVPIIALYTYTVNNESYFHSGVLYVPDNPLLCIDFYHVLSCRHSWKYRKSEPQSHILLHLIELRFIYLPLRVPLFKDIKRGSIHALPSVIPAIVPPHPSDQDQKDGPDEYPENDPQKYPCPAVMHMFFQLLLVHVLLMSFESTDYYRGTLLWRKLGLSLEKIMIC